MAKEREVNIIIDAKNKAKGAFLEVRKDLKQLGEQSKEGLGALSSSFDKADKVIYSFADRMKWMDKIAKRTFQGTAAAAGVYIGATLKDFTQLNDGISKVNTLYDQTAESQKKMYQDSIKMFKLIPTDFKKITQGIYDTISAGGDPKYASMFARKFGMAGVAGDADMDVVTKAAMGTMNAYKAEVNDLDRILDLQFMTVKKGITSYDELASSLGTGVLASAKSAGITMEELYGSIALITKNAIPAAVATTSLNQMFNKFTDTKVIKEFKKFGVEIQDAKKNTRPLIEIFKDLNYQFDKRKMTSEQRKGFLKELVGSEQAARAIAPMISDLKEYESILNSMDNSSGAMKDAYNDRLENIKTQIQLMWNGLKGAGAEQIEKLNPLIEAITGPWIKKNKIEMEIVDLEDAIDMEDDPVRKEQFIQAKEMYKIEFENIELAPVEELRDALAESVRQLELLNPPLAKFLDTIGNFVLNFVGDEGAENREKAGNVAETALRIYGAKKFVDIMNWFNKNFKLPGNKKDTSIPETLTKNLQTMNVKASVVNIYGSKSEDVKKPTVVADSPKNKTKDSKTTSTNSKKVLENYQKSLTTGIYIPEEYKVGGDKFNEFKDEILKIRENKNIESRNQDKQYLIDKYQPKPIIDPVTNMINTKLINELMKMGNPKQYLIDKYQPKPVVDPFTNTVNTKLIDELKKIDQMKQIIDNKVSMQSNIKVEPPKVDVYTKVYLDGKSLPIPKLDVDYIAREVDKRTSKQATRYGRPETSLC